MFENPYCGGSLPPSQISTNNHLFLHFHSNILTAGTGFKLEYNATSKNQSKAVLVHFVSRAKKRTKNICYLKNIDCSALANIRLNAILLINKIIFLVLVASKSVIVSYISIAISIPLIIQCI
jgi:hypothetical protein